jgi:hypothetical protein
MFSAQAASIRRDELMPGEQQQSNIFNNSSGGYAFAPASSLLCAVSNPLRSSRSTT